MKRDFRGKETKQINAKVELECYRILNQIAGENSLGWAIEELTRRAKGKRTATTPLTPA